MDLSGSSSLRHRRSSSTGRFLGVPRENPSAAVTSSVGDELNEDDVFWTGDFAESSHQNSGFTTASSSIPSPTTPRHNPLLHHPKGFSQPETFGILAALPEDETSPSIRKNSLFYHKASIPSSSASSSRMIPIIPKPPQERIALPSSVMYHQSAPVNVPAMVKMRRKHRDFDEVEDEDDGQGGGEILPPHEIVARSSAQSPALACSVLEGVGRTLKGRDLRQGIRGGIHDLKTQDEMPSDLMILSGSGASCFNSSRYYKTRKLAFVSLTRSSTIDSLTTADI